MSARLYANARTRARKARRERTEKLRDRHDWYAETEDELIAATEKLVDSLTAPLYGFRMARGLLAGADRSEPVQRGARARMISSALEIEDAVREYRSVWE